MAGRTPCSGLPFPDFFGHKTSMNFLKRYILQILSLAAITSNIACSDDFGAENEPTSEQIRFTVADFQHIDSAASRSSAAPELVDVVAMASECGGDSLFLEIYAEDCPVAEAEAEVKSRGTQILNLYNSSFGLIGYKYLASDGWDGNQTPNMACNDKVEMTDNNPNPTKEYFWPGGRYLMRFFGVAPYDTQTVCSSDKKGDPTLDYTVPTQLDKQVDIMTGKSDEIKGNTYKAIQLTFSHPLSTLSFVTDRTAKYYSSGAACGSFYAGYVGDLKIKNVYGTATYNLDKGVWTDHRDKTSYTLSINSNKSGSSEQAITPTTEFFFIVPQTAPADAEIEFTLRDTETKTDRVFHGSLAGITWEPGKTYTYRLATSSIKIDYVFEVEAPENLSLDIDGGEIELKVKSYKIVSREGDESKYVRVNWTSSIEEQYNNRTWATLVGVNGVNSLVEKATDYHNCRFKISHMSHDKRLKDIRADFRKMADNEDYPYNLASESFSRNSYDIKNTANCYIVDFEGWACFPTVFGPTYQDGSKREFEYYGEYGYCTHDFDFINDGNNYSCYINNQHLHPTAAIPMRDNTWNWDSNTNSYEQIIYMEQYKSHYNFIKDYLWNTNVYDWDEFTARLDWSDADAGKDFITGVELFDDNDYIRFKTNGEYGNAVISLYDNHGNRVWSWHIWCTDQLKSSTDVAVSNNGQNYTMAGVDLGWVPKREYTYHDTQFRIQLTQGESSKKTDYIYVNQTTDKIFLEGHTPLWQFGRPTPLAYGGCVDENGKTVTTKAQSVATSNYLIERLYNNLTLSWEYYMTTPDKSYVNIWSWDNTGTDYTDDAVRKSLYDPCPAGYCMPSGLAFSAFGFSNSADQQPNTASENPNLNPSPVYGNCIGLYANSSRTKTVDFYGSRCTDNGSNLTDEALYYLTSQGFVTFMRDAGQNYFQYYYGRDGKPYLGTASPKSIGGCIRPVREE